MIKLGMMQKIKKIFKKPTKKSLGKIGLFLIFGMMVWNLNISNAQALTWSESFEIIVDNLAATPGRMADTVSNGAYIVANPIESAFKGMLFAVLEAISFLITVAGGLFDIVIDYDFLNSFLRNDGVYNGWVIVRDVLNMFFMLLLLFSAFATIFQVEKYHLRKIIIMLVVMALLVNFSYPITLFVVDFSNSAMYFFVDAIVAPSKSSKIANIVQFGSTISTSVALSSEFKDIIVTIVFAFMFLMTLVALSINLLIRIVAFTILIILSPAGFVFAFFPDTKNVASDWWSALFKYAFMGPIMMFFVYLSVLIFSINDAVKSKFSSNNDVAVYVSYLIPTAFLWIGLVAAQKFGGSGAGIAMDMAKKTGNMIKSGAWGATKFGGHWVDKKMANKTGFSYMGLKQAWKNRQEDDNREALANSSGKMEDVLEHVVSRASSLNPFIGATRAVKGFKDGGIKGAWNELIDPSDRDKTDNDYIAKATLANKKAKEIEEISTNSSYVMGRLKDATSVDEVHAALKVLAKQNDLNDLMIAETGKWEPEVLPSFLKSFYTKQGLTDESHLGRKLMEISDIGASNGNFGYYNIGGWDESKKDFAVSDDIKKRASSAVSKFSNSEPQARQRMLHPDSVFEYDNVGTTGFSETGINLMNTMTGDDIAQLDRTRGDFKKRMAEFIELKNTFGVAGNEARAQYAQLNANAKVYVNAVEGMYKGLDKSAATTQAKTRA
jgi:hypothetical protein